MSAPTLELRAFVVIYDRPLTMLRELHQFTDLESAKDFLWDAEDRYRRKDEMEVVLLISRSLAELIATHGRYFGVFR